MAAFTKSYPNPYFQNILSNSTFIPIFNEYNTLINNHTLDNITNLTEIRRLERLLNNELFNIVDLNSRNITTLPKLGTGIYGTAVNMGNGTIIKNQNTSQLFLIFKESLIQQKLSCDPLYGHTIPYVFSLKKHTKNIYRINMEKVDTSKYIRFDNFLNRLSLNTVLSNKQKIIVLFKKLIGLSTVINYFQNTYGFIHNDLKPDNFFVSRKWDLDLSVIDTNIKIIDFGLSGIKEGTNYIISQPTMLEGCDLLFYSKFNERNYSFTSDFIYLITFIIKSYKPLLQNIFGTYYNSFETLFDSHIDYKGTIYNISLINILNEFSHISSYASFVASKNEKIMKQVIIKLYKIKYSKSVLNSEDKKIVKELLLSFYSIFSPDTIDKILMWYITRYLSPITPSTTSKAVVATSSASHVPTPHVPTPHVPTPHVPTPHVPTPHVPTPHVPTPRVSASRTSASRGSAPHALASRGSASRGSASRTSASRGSASRGSASRGSASRGSASRGSASRGSASRGSASRGSASRGSASRGSASRGSASRGSASRGSASRGSASRGSASRGSVLRGSASRGKRTNSLETVDLTPYYTPIGKI